MSDLHDNSNNRSYGTSEQHIEIEFLPKNIKKIQKFHVLIYVLILLFSLIFYIGYIDINNLLLDSSLENKSKNKSTYSKPNIVFILADDMSWSSIGYTSSGETPLYLTENLTNLAADGVILKNYYAQEVCTPSRASLLTGRMPISFGMQFGLIGISDTWGLPLDETLLPQVLSDNGYKNYALGKWHLGNFNPQYLPTARGFDEFTGYQTGQTFYWSKLETTMDTYVDFITADKDCYYKYTAEDLNDYSTFMYTTKAKSIIESHKSGEVPFFLYLALQNVHDPFNDFDEAYEYGVPDSYIPSDILSQISDSASGSMRREYFKSLYLMDQAIGEIKLTLENTGLMDNTYLIFASDNGGCIKGGGFNGPFRGSKGTLWEGGSKVDSFIYSPLLPQSSVIYDGLFHVSDWFPTILSLVHITYTPSDDHSLDGVDHSSAWFDDTLKPRTTLIYNIYKNTANKFFNIWENGSFAIRNEQYKLMHTYNYTLYDSVYENEDVTDYDDVTVLNYCSQENFEGTFSYYLYDLINDPYESRNLYNSSDNLISIQNELYEVLADATIALDTRTLNIETSSEHITVWESTDNHVVPWKTTEYSETASSSSYPSYCSNDS